MIDVYIGEEKSKIDYKKIKKIYIQGICGTAMSGVAKILLDDGKEVFGADNNFYSPIREMLQRLKIDLIKGLKPENLEKNPDLIIVGNIMSKNHPESIAVREKRIPYTSFPELFKNYYLKNKVPIVVAGTNGKTTTTSLLAHCLNYLKEKPSFFVGGIPLNFEVNAKLDGGKYFVLEGDEYETAYFEKTPKFWQFCPSLSIITSIKYDHIDFFKSYEDYLKAFIKFIENHKGLEKIFICKEDCKDLLKKFKKREFITYGFEKGSKGLISKLIKQNINGTAFELKIENEKYLIEIPMMGLQNIKNFSAVFLMLKYLNFLPDKIVEAFKEFKGVKRRQEILFKNDDFILIDDFAHHPEAVYITLKGLKENLKDFKLLAIFEPRTNTSRTQFFQKEYSKSFEFADSIIILPPPQTKEGYKPLNLQKLSKSLEKRGKEVLSGINSEEIIDYIRKTLKPKTAIVTLSNGPMDDLPQKILKLFL